jgi:ethanolamine utilization protein EutN
MDLARIVGTIVATQKDPTLTGVKLCVLQPLDENLEPDGSTLVAVDATAKRGEGELVYFVTSAEASFTSPDGVQMPADAAVCGIVDHLDVVREHLPEKG